MVNAVIRMKTLLLTAFCLAVFPTYLLHAEDDDPQTPNLPALHRVYAEMEKKKNERQAKADQITSIYDRIPSLDQNQISFVLQEFVKDLAILKDRMHCLRNTLPHRTSGNEHLAIEQEAQQLVELAILQILKLDVSNHHKIKDWRTEITGLGTMVSACLGAALLIAIVPGHNPDGLYEFFSAAGGLVCGYLGFGASSEASYQKELHQFWIETALKLARFFQERLIVNRISLSWLGVNHGQIIADIEGVISRHKQPPHIFENKEQLRFQDLCETALLPQRVRVEISETRHQPFEGTTRADETAAREENQQPASSATSTRL